MKSGYAEREDEAGASPATPGESSLLEQEEVLMMASFDGISEARKRELDSICEPTWTPAECRENAELWEEYFERKAEGLSADQKNELWHRIMTSAFETDAGALPPFALSVRPAGEEEERYVQWRCDFNLRKKSEQLALDAVAGRRSVGKLAEEVANRQKTIEELAGGLCAFVAKINVKMSSKEFRLFLLLVAPGANGNGVLTYEQIGQKLKGIKKQTVSAQAKKLKGKFPECWSLITNWRKSGKKCRYNDSISSGTSRPVEEEVDRRDVEQCGTGN